MEYTIQQLANLAGVSTRTLRYYDEIQLLKPKRLNDSGYRIYGTKEVDRLQQILFFRELGMKLEDIQVILTNHADDLLNLLQKHKAALEQKKAHITALIQAVDQTIAAHKGENTMSDQEKFAAFKQKALAENEAKFGEEIRAKYGEETVEAANQKWQKLSEQDLKQMQQLEKDLIEDLKIVAKSNDLDSSTAKEIYDYHKKWLSYSLPHYSAEIHQSLADMYVADERFRKYYDDKAEMPVTEVLCAIIKKYAK